MASARLLTRARIITKRKADEPMTCFTKVEKPTDAMAVDGCDYNNWVPTPLDKNGELIVDKELHERRCGSPWGLGRNWARWALSL